MIFEDNENISDEVKKELDRIERFELFEPEESRVKEIIDQRDLSKEEAEEEAIEEKFSSDTVEELEDTIEVKSFPNFWVEEGKVQVKVKVVDSGRHNRKLFHVEKELPFVYRPSHKQKKNYQDLSMDSERISFMASMLGLE